MVVFDSFIGHQIVLTVTQPWDKRVKETDLKMVLLWAQEISSIEPFASILELKLSSLEHN